MFRKAYNRIFKNSPPSYNKEEKKVLRQITKTPINNKEFMRCLYKIAVSKDSHIDTQTEEFCIISVENLGESILYVKNQTPAICLAAVKKYVIEQTEEMCFKYVIDQTEEICLASLVESRYVNNNFNLVKNQTENICIAAVKLKIYNFELVKNQTEM
jgi:hypothetical protein